jgi:hypothetical protein
MLLWQSRGNRESELAHLIQFAKVGAGETAKTVASPDLPPPTLGALPAGSSAVGCSFGNNLDSGRERLHWHPEADRQRLRLT